MKVNKKGLFLVLDTVLQVAPFVTIQLVSNDLLYILFLGAVWQLISYSVISSWGNISKYRKAYISVSLFTLGLLAVGLLFIGIGIALNSYVVVVGMFVLGASMLLGVALYISYFIITLSSLAIEIKKCIKRIRENFAHKLHEQNLGDWWV